MKHLIFIIAIVFSANSGRSQTRPATQLDSLFTLLHNQDQFNGIIFIAERDSVIFNKGYGFANESTKSSINDRTIFELASCSKQFTGAAIVLLKREGKLDYNDKVSKYIPELGFWEGVTIYDLLRHTSGIPDFIFGMDKKWDPKKIATNEDVIKFFVNRKDTLQFKPKTIHRYSNTNYVLLASVIEKISGKKYGDYLAENIFKPLKMYRTFVYDRRKNPKDVENYAIGYVWAHNSFDKVTMDSPEYDEQRVYYLDGVEGAAKVNSTAQDMYKWLCALTDHTLLTQKEFEEMTRVTNTSSGKRIPYGFGFDINRGENKFSYGHTGSWDGYTTFIYQDSIKHRSVVILQNFSLGATAINNIFQILNGRTITKEFEQKVDKDESFFQQFTGKYVDGKAKEHLITYNDKHLIYNTGSGQWNMRFLPYSDTGFFAIRQGGANGILKFKKLDNGDTDLEMLENDKVIGHGIRRKL